MFLALAAGCGDADGPNADGAIATDTTPTADADVVACVTSDDCAALAGPCVTATCDAGACAVTVAAEDTPCDDGDACVVDQSCHGGVCMAGVKAPTACGERECGADACGNVCGTCPAGRICDDAGRCDFDPSDCGEIGYAGCCTDDGRVAWCDKGALTLLSCGGDDPQIGPVCGWLSGQGYYWCVGEERSAPGPGGHPWLCPGESCGDDPCAGRECGSRCGESCGRCEGEGEWCDDDGACQPSECGDVGFVGCCRADGTTVWCEDGRLRERDCGAERDGVDHCGWVPSEDYYFCTDAERASGDPELPWLCPGETCDVEAACAGRACGMACGASCGTCADGERCTDDGRCEPGDCGEIGFAGCCRADNTLIWCEDGRLLGQRCGVGDLPPACAWDEDGPYYSCGAAEIASSSEAQPWLCPDESCGEDPCEGRACGYRCGVACGTCPNEDDLCTPEGTCKPNTCGDMTFVGCCDGDVSVYCADNEIKMDDCGLHGLGCGWDGEHGWYDCGFAGEDPTGASPLTCDGYDFPR